MIEIVIFEGDTANWTFSLKRGGTAIDLANASAAMSVPYLGITAAVMVIDGATDTAMYLPVAGATQGKACYHTDGFVTVTFVGGEVETFPFVLTVRPKSLWDHVSPTTSTSTSTTSSTSTTTTL